jgi:hypothetical protein
LGYSGEDPVIQVQKKKQYDEVKEKRHGRVNGRGDDYDPLGETDLSENIPFRQETHHSHHGCFGKKGPKYNAQQQPDGIVGDTAEKKMRKHEVQDQEQTERLQENPDDAEPGSLVPHLQVGLCQHPDGFPQVDRIDLIVFQGNSIHPQFFYKWLPFAV